MSRYFNYLAAILFFISLNLTVYSQNSKVKFGKISKEQLEADYCPIDSNAHAYYIFDHGFSYFQYATTRVSDFDTYGSKKGFQLYHKRHFRIKILDNQGFGWADVKIPLYKDTDEESIGTIKAFTYSMEEGKVVKSKLDKQDMFREETSKHWDQIKFAMPGVKEGSIIEIEYTIISDYYFNLREWAFQTSIPVLHSEYKVDIPEYFHYNQTQKGYFPFKTETSEKPKAITITHTSHKGGQSLSPSGRSDTYTSKTDYRDKCYHFEATNIPAFPLEDFLRTERNYLTMIMFELESLQFPQQKPHLYSTTWETVDKRLDEHNDFGWALDRRGHLKDDVALLEVLGIEGADLVNLAFNTIRRKIAWNGLNALFINETLSKAYREGSGNSADVNLNLVALLDELGFESYPVVLSTQKHGIIHPAHPSISSFNYVIAMVRLEGSIYLMDATDPYSEINLLPVRCLNDKGRIIGSPGHDWVNLMDYRPFLYSSTDRLVLTDSLTLSGTRDLALKDYGSYYYRKSIKGYSDLEAYEEKLDEQDPDVIIENLAVTGLDSGDNKLSLSYDLLSSNHVEGGADMLYFSPVLNPYFETNPFKLDKREYPVEFNYPYSIMQNYFITVPEGYSISELPKPMITKMPDNGARFTYNAVLSGQALMVSTALTIKKSQFLPVEYEILKQFFQLIMDKQNELIVLKKN